MRFPHRILSLYGGTGSIQHEKTLPSILRTLSFETNLGRFLAQIGSAWFKQRRKYKVYKERWLKFSTVITVSENNGMGEGSHSVGLKHAAFNLPNDHANSSTCLDDHAIMAIFETCAVKNA